MRKCWVGKIVGTMGLDRGKGWGGSQHRDKGGVRFVFFFIKFFFW